MAVLTENDIRKLFNEKVLMEKGEFYLEKDMILTPSARTYLADKNIIIRTDHLEDKTRYQTESVRMKKDKENIRNKETEMEIEKQKEEIYETLFGITLHEKPEHMTHLRGNLLVFKDNGRIALRGAIDTLESEIFLLKLLHKKKVL